MCRQSASITQKPRPNQSASLDSLADACAWEQDMGIRVSSGHELAYKLSPLDLLSGEMFSAFRYLSFTILENSATEFQSPT